MVDAERTDARGKFEKVGCENKKENRREEREKAPRQVSALQSFSDVVVDEAEKRLKE